MTEVSFAPKEVIAQEVCRLEVLSAETADTYGPQIGLKLKVVGGEHEAILSWTTPTATRIRAR
jgi:hypothetical protein